MDYMATSAQLQAAQYGQFAAQQQYQQQPGLLYGAQQLAAAQYSPYSPQQPQPVRHASLPIPCYMSVQRASRHG